MIGFDEPMGRALKLLLIEAIMEMLAKVCGNLVLSEEDYNVKTNGCNLSMILIYATIN